MNPIHSYTQPAKVSLEETCHTLLSSLSMNGDETILGLCPNCSTEISETWLLVEYGKEDGTEGIWAECPICNDVVAPD